MEMEKGRVQCKEAADLLRLCTYTLREPVR